MKYIYLIESDVFYKIGVASEPRGRIKELQTGNPHKINLVASCRVENAYGAERCIHSVLSSFNISGEWFRLINDDVAVIKEVFQSIEMHGATMPKTSRPQWVDILDRVRR